MILFFGPAGSGKSTQGRALADKYGWKWLSVGQVIRDTGKFDEITKRGELVDNQIVIDLMNQEIQKAKDEGMNVILDGYPRDIEQARIMFVENNTGLFDDIDGAIVLDVPKEESLKRILKRGRNDDTEDVLARRFEIFEQNICSILPLLESKNVKITTVDGVGEFDDVTDRIDREISLMVSDAIDVGDIEKVNRIENDVVVREKSYGE